MLFTPIQFGLRNLPLAAADILIVLITIPVMMRLVWKHHRWVAIAQVPYLIWVSLATTGEVGGVEGTWELWGQA